MSEETPQRRTQRNQRIELLRLVAIVGIAVFHTFQPWFAAATDGTWQAEPVTLVLLGCISLLGAFGNHVFFLISGHFLIPRAATAATKPGYWPDQLRRTGRRALPILATVALYAVLALAVSTWIHPLSGVSLHQSGWLVGGLQFIWVYLVVVAVTPVIGWMWARVRRPRIVVAVIVAVVFAVNAYIAFVSPGSDERGLLEWRKLMSAVSYLVAFLVGGAVAEKDREHAGAPLAVCLAACVCAEGVAGMTRNLWLLDALSFKSTSLLSFALAVAALLAVTSAPAPEQTRAGRLACALTPSILGFYVAQSMLYSLWHPIANELCAAAGAYGELAIIATGCAFSLVFLACVLAFDRLVRISLLRLARLS